MSWNKLLSFWRLGCRQLQMARTLLFARYCQQITDWRRLKYGPPNWVGLDVSKALHGFVAASMKNGSTHTHRNCYYSVRWCAVKKLQCATEVLCPLVWKCLRKEICSCSTQISRISYHRLLIAHLVRPEALIPGALASQRNRSVPHGTQLLATCAQGALINRLDLGEIIQQESALANP